jgi:Zn-dependent protease with chaperone function
MENHLLRGLLAGGLALIVTACQTVQTTEAGAVGVDRKQTMTSLVSSQEVEKQAAQQYAQVLAQAKKKDLLNQDPQQVQRVRAVAARLIPQVAVFRSDAVKWTWEVNVLTSKDINAWCMPGGKIAVYTGLIERLKLTDDELAAVMGHEIAHALREHARERMGRQMATETATVVGALALEIFTGVRLDPQLAGTFTQAMFVLPNSRENEQESDFIGVELAARGGAIRAPADVAEDGPGLRAAALPVAVDASQPRNAPARPAGLRAEGHAAVRGSRQAERATVKVILARSAARRLRQARVRCAP